MAILAVVILVLCSIAFIWDLQTDLAENKRMKNIWHKDRNEWIKSWLDLSKELSKYKRPRQKNGRFK